MPTFLDRVMRYTPMRSVYERWRNRSKERRRPSPPHVKQAIIREYGDRFKLTTLVETGTYKGDMIAASRNHFTRLYSIELSPELHSAACERFAGDPAVEILKGDSGVVLATLIPKLDAPTLFWLDGHYSSGVTAKGMSNTPIWAELEHVMAVKQPFAILIDDARDFNGRQDYPTIAQVKKFVRRRLPGWKFTVEKDIIRIVPSSTRGA